MAESQVPYLYDTSSLPGLRDAISEPRFETYLKVAGNHADYAMAMYLYNCRLAKAFLYPLNVVEVTLRNRIDLVLTKSFTPNWPSNGKFRSMLDADHGVRALDLAISRTGGRSTSRTVAALTFDFWSNLFRPEYGEIWRFTLNIAFPHLPRGISRQDIQDSVKAINTFRNRIAHHEPILAENAPTTLNKIAEIVGYCSPITLAWMRHHTTVGEVLRTRPSRDGAAGLMLKSKLDHNTLLVTTDTTVDEIFGKIDHAHPAIICIDAHGSPTAALTIFDVIAFINGEAQKEGGLILLSDFTVGGVLGSYNHADHWRVLPHTHSLAEAIKVLQEPLIRVLVGVDDAGKAIGAVVRSHRRY